MMGSKMQNHQLSWVYSQIDNLGDSAGKWEIVRCHWLLQLSDKLSQPRTLSDSLDLRKLTMAGTAESPKAICSSA